MRWTVLALGLLVLGGCLNKADTKKVDDAQARFWSEMAAKAYGQIWDEAAPDLKASASRDDLIAFMQRLDAAYGDCKPATKAFNIHVNANSNGYFTTQGYASQCAKGRLETQLTTVLRGGEAKVAGFHLAGPGSSEASTSGAGGDAAS